MKKFAKSERHKQLKIKIREKPFATDEELAKCFNVSIQTIRLDRLELGIPELRERIKQVAETASNEVRSISGGEIVGQLVELKLGDEATSILNVSADMVAEKSKICRGHHIYSQANTLAVALIDADIVLTGGARIRYKRPVYLHEAIICKARVTQKRTNKFLVKIISKVGAEEVFNGKFIVVAR